MLLTSIAIIVSIYAVLCLWLHSKQRSLLYFPTSAPTQVEAQTFELLSDELKLKGWVLNPGKSHALLYFGGNGEAVEYNIDVFKNTLPDVSVYLLPYRSYSGNPGEAAEENLYRDALNFHDHVKTKHKDIHVIGRSLGSGVATYVASKRAINKLVLVTPYDSIANVAQGHYPFFPVSLILKDRYESWRRADIIKADVLVLIAGKDEVIPRRHSDNLVRHFVQKPEVVVFEQADHNDISDTEQYHAAIASFVADAEN